jgi:uroporphyrinogen decarboxylase
MMDNKKRVLTALNHGQPDKVPYNIVFTQKAHAKMIEFYNDPDFISKLGNCFININTTPRDGWKEINSSVFEDQFGVQWDRTVDKDIGVVCNCLVNPDNIDKYIFPDADDPSRYENYNSVIRSNPDGFFISDIGFSLFERAWTLAGMENVLMAMVDKKGFANKLLDKILEYNLKVIENAASFNIDAMMFGDDWGQQRGLIMGPVLWREFIKPRIKEMYSAVKENASIYLFTHAVILKRFYLTL